MKEGQRALMWTHFMRARAARRAGMVNMMRGFSVTVVGVCVLLISTGACEKSGWTAMKKPAGHRRGGRARAAPNIRPANWLSEAVERSKAAGAGDDEGSALSSGRNLRFLHLPLASRHATAKQGRNQGTAEQNRCAGTQ